ncbi:hypothetical protein C3942_10540 [Solimonas fluminis]|uniref:Outer membrane protein beta-barrel domain-containing protein n=1 Tax=Solimonas fluminis TaxID=2086571 RepID=A0A2S5TFS6_9GAMM|nr:hypothetical protein [Solimonas fluminis]PPE73835.1 hypothetical protein C3942_10540 [Solimonas fluminis]
MRNKKTAMVLLMLMAPGMAQADEVARHGGLGLRLGTAGIGIDYTYGLNRFFDLRAGYNFGSYSDSYEEDGIDYDADLKISAASLMVDYKPFAGGFRISAGLYTSAPELDLDARTRNNTETFEVGDREYRGDDLRLDGGIDLGSTAPYLGIGWGGTTNATGFGVSFDLGVMFTQSPDVALAASGRACDATANPDCDPTDPAESFDAASNPLFQTELQNEVKNLEDDSEDFKFWPVLSLGLHYRF